MAMLVSGSVTLPKNRGRSFLSYVGIDWESPGPKKPIQRQALVAESLHLVAQLEWQEGLKEATIFEAKKIGDF